MKRIIALIFLALVPIQGFAKEQLRKFRHNFGHQRDGDPTPQVTATELIPKRGLLKGVGEFVFKAGQMVGKAQVAGSWKQTVFSPKGEVTFDAGAVIDKAPTQAALAAADSELTNALQSAMGSLPELKSASRVFPPTLEVRQNDNSEWVPYWKVEYLTPAGDRLCYVMISRKGKSIESGQLDWDGADGRADVYPDGPKAGGVQEETLRDLNGDGTMTGRLLHVMSALDLKVWSPELTFIFPQSDQRFDLGQAYFTIDRGYHWLKEHLGIELDHPIDVRLHVGNNGVSNAAFYHENTIYLGTGDGETYKDLILDPSVLIHESIHAVIDAYASLPSEGEGGGYNEGFADLFTALILDNPKMGEASYLKGPFRRTLENQLKAYSDFTPGVYQNGSILGGTFWDMKAILGNELTAKLAFRTLVRLGKGAKFDDFPSALADAGKGLITDDQARQVADIARARGWKI
jgi:Zn-dependent metalloprotease